MLPGIICEMGFSISFEKGIILACFDSCSFVTPDAHFSMIIKIFKINQVNIETVKMIKMNILCIINELAYDFSVFRMVACGAGTTSSRSAMSTCGA